MGAPIEIGGSYALWISNSMKDAFCDVLVEVAALQGLDIRAIYDDFDGICGLHGITGVAIPLERFETYLGGPEGVRKHLDTCRARLHEVASLCELTPWGEEYMQRVLAWASHIDDGKEVPPGTKFHEDWPPGFSPQLDVEAFAKTDASAVISALSKLMGPLGPAGSSDEDPLIFQLGSAAVVLGASEDEFLSVWVRGSIPWTSCIALGRFLAKELHCTVRCDPGTEFPEVSPHSNVFLEIEGDAERLIAWG